MDSMPEQAKIAVGIIGAGIAGLSAAIALRQVGHDVEVRTAISGSGSMLTCSSDVRTVRIQVRDRGCYHCHS